MALACTIKPLSAFLSTNLNNKIKTYDNLGDRIKRSLGYPLISLEIHTDQLRQNIQIAVEYFTKYAGFTQEYLIFDSDMYEAKKGIRLDLLYTVANQNLNSGSVAGQNNPLGPSPESIRSYPPTRSSQESVYVATSTLSASYFTGFSALSTTFAYQQSGLEPGLNRFEVFNQTVFNNITAWGADKWGTGGSLTPGGDNATFLSAGTFGAFKKTQPVTVTFEGSASNALYYQNVFDYDIMEYRKVVDVTDFEEGSTTGINTLFTLEQTLAQQTYFSYALGNYGFDLVSWYTLKEWMDTREKVLGTRRDVKFDPRSQYLQMYPEPGSNRFYGVVSCYLERAIRDVIMEQWIYEYAMALSMITIGRVRGKFGDVSLLGGGALNSGLLQEGLDKKAELEAKLFEGASPGFGDTDPTLFIVG
jgi:hypothetical protein|tara:strand:- start:2117 stop:3367 length:1251 start_codon:yes stop_codon:yes gene_type:complete